MPGPERKIRNKVMAWLKAQKATTPLWWFAVIGGGAQTPGVPDLCLVVDGRSVWFEFKSLDGKLTDMQRHVKSQIESAGGAVFVIRSVDDAVRAFEVIEQAEFWEAREKEISNGTLAK